MTYVLFFFAVGYGSMTSNVITGFATESQCNKAAAAVMKEQMVKAVSGVAVCIEHGGNK